MLGLVSFKIGRDQDPDNSEVAHLIQLATSQVKMSIIQK